MSRSAIRTAAFLFSSLLVALDLGSKAAVFRSLEPAGLERDLSRVVVPGFLSLRQIRNTGGVWGVGGDFGHYLVYFRAVAAAALVVLLWRSRASKPRLLAGLSLVLAGAAGNLYDSLGYMFPRWRPELTSVRDFLYFHIAGGYFPAFNIADVCICVGAAFLVLHMTCERR